MSLIGLIGLNFVSGLFPDLANLFLQMIINLDTKKKTPNYYFCLEASSPHVSIQELINWENFMSS
jgi:hypothetical protein